MLNARDALEEESRDLCLAIEISVATFPAEGLSTPPEVAEEALVRVQVKDHGSGMDAATRERIFEPFFTTKEVGKGTGLGLSTAYAILQDHNGWIECESELGRGTTFSVYLPARAREPSAEELQTQEPVVGGRETILVVDDEEAVRTTVGSVLERYGYAVLTAVDGAEGLEAFRRLQDRIDLVLLDLSMPRMSGQEVLAGVHALEPGQRVIFFTGYAAPESACEGVKATITKPIVMPRLLQAVRTVLDS